MKTELLNFLHIHWAEISLLTYEIIARLVPTSKNLSLVDLLLKLTGKGLEITQKGADKILPNNQKNTLKSFFLFALLLIGLSANAQLNLTGKTLRLTTGIAAKDTLANAVNGQLYFNHTTQDLRLRQAGTWQTLVPGAGGGGGGLSTANNGLTAGGANVQLGGALIANTTLSGAFDLRLNNTSQTFSATSLRINNPANTFNYSFSSSAITANRVITLPLISANRTMMLLNTSVTSGIPHQGGVGGEYNSTTGFTFDGTTFSTPNIVSAGRGTFTPSATLPGLNVGSFAGNPSTPVNGDLWLNSSTGALMGRINTVSNPIVNGQLTINRVPFASSSAVASITDDAGFTFNTTGDVLSVGRLLPLTTATLPGLNAGVFGGDPSTLTNGDIWYNSTTNRLRARVNGVSSSLISNTAPANFLPKSDANGDLITTGISSTTDGSLLLGTGLVSALNRRITADGTPADLSLSLFAKGTGNVSTFSNGGVGFFDLAGNDALTFTFTAAAWRIGTSTIAATVRNLDLQPNNKNEASIKGDGVRIIAANNTGATSTGGDVLLQPGTGTTAHGKVIIETLNGNGTFAINDGANEQMGLATLVGGTLVVNNTKITANTRVFLSVQTAGGTQGFLRIAARTAGTSFTITSTSGTETSTVAWLLVEPN